MNIKKMMLGVACVLAATVAAQTAHAQFFTRAEREMWGNTARAFGSPKTQAQPQAKQKEAPKQKKQQTPRPKAQPKQNARQTQQPRPSSVYVGYNPVIYSGREGKAMLGGEMMLERLLRQKVEQAGLEEAKRQTK